MKFVYPIIPQLLENANDEIFFTLLSPQLLESDNNEICPELTWC
jgi:hypothetical protein